MKLFKYNPIGQKAYSTLGQVQDKKRRTPQSAPAGTNKRNAQQRAAVLELQKLLG